MIQKHIYSLHSVLCQFITVITQYFHHTKQTFHCTPVPYLTQHAVTELYTKIFTALKNMIFKMYHVHLLIYTMLDTMLYTFSTEMKPPTQFHRKYL
jgi:hypothetical protein